MTLDRLTAAVRRFASRDRRRRATASHAAELRALIAELAPQLARAEQHALLVQAAIGGDAWNVRPVVAAVKQLLALGIDANARTDVHRTYPIRSGKPCLHAVVCSFHHPNSRAGESPAVVKANNRVIEAGAIALVRGGASLGPHGGGRMTPLHHAAWYGAGRLVRELVRAGSDLEARDFRGETPVCIAARNDHVAIVRMLVDAGARATTNKHRETAYEIAIAFGATRTAAYLARRWDRNAPAIRSSLTDREIARLLARRARTRHSIFGPSGDPDPVLAKVLRGGAVTKQRIELAIDPATASALSPSLRGELLAALGEEVKRWLGYRGVSTSGYEVGGMKPWFHIRANSRARAEKLIAGLRVAARVHDRGGRHGDPA